MPRSTLAALQSLLRVARRHVSAVLTVFVALVAVLAAFAPLLLFAAPAKAQDRITRDESASVHAVRLDSPAVVRIITVFSGRVICVACYQGQDIPFPLDGKSSYSVDSGGSGMLISPDGYILTADHVVDVDAAVQQYMLSQAINELAQKAGVTQATAQQAFQQSQQAGQIRYDINVTQRTAFLSTAFIGTVHAASQVSDPQTAFPITRVVASSTPDKQDVAIVKIEGHDLPNARLAPTGGVNVQDNVSAIAFPGDADVGNPFDLLNPQAGSEVELNNLLTPTVESGQIIAVKHLGDGTSVYQANQIGNHGSSGGAVINDRGEIVGFIDAANGNDGNPTRVVDLISNDVIASYVQQAGVTNSGQGTFMTRWTRALGALDSNDVCQAVPARDQLRQLSADYPRFGAIQPFARQAQDWATSAHCGPSAGVVAGVSGLVVLLLGAAAAVLYYLHRRGTLRLPIPAAPRLAPASSPVPQPVGALPGALMAAPIYPSMSPWSGAPVGASVGGPVGASAGASATYPAPFAPPYLAYSPPSPYPTPYPAPAPSYSPSRPTSATTAPTFMAPAAPAPDSSATIAPTRTTAVSGQLAMGAPAPRSMRASEVRRCTNGHTVTDDGTRFCPTCGAPVFF